MVPCLEAGLQVRQRCVSAWIVPLPKSMSIDVVEPIPWTDARESDVVALPTNLLGLMVQRLVVA